MIEKEKNIWLIIVRYLDGTLSGEESDYLEKWLNSSNENRKILHSVDQIWKASDTSSQKALLKELNLERDWDIIENKINSRDPALDSKRAEEHKRNRKRHQITSNLVKAAALILVALTSAFLTLQYAPVDQTVSHEPAFREITTEPGERANIDLGDGTKLVLNSGSKLVIPDTFSQSKRVVSLSGQAFFDVHPDRDRPFYIKTQNALIAVLGTSFDVRSYEEENEIQVVVSEGTVEFSNTDTKSDPLILNEGYLGKMNVPEKSLKIETVQNMDTYFGWINGRLIFKEKQLKSVFTEISRWYDVQIILNLTDESVLDNTLTADLKTRSVRDVMDVIAMSMDIDYEIDDEIVVISNR
jgi:ferric-dicitrate binding protein FerR (iron transport regulator)